MKENPVHARVPADRSHGGPERFPGPVPLNGRPKVYRVGQGHPFGRDGLQLVKSSPRKLGGFQAHAFQKIRRDDSSSAAVSEHRDPSRSVVGNLGIARERPGEVRHLSESRGLHDTRLIHDSPDQIIVPGETGRMAHGRRRPLLALAALEQHDGFGRFPAQLVEPPASVDGFQIKADRLGLHVADQVFQDVAFVDVGLVSDGANLARSHDSPRHQVDQESAGKHAALHDHGDFPLSQFVVPDLGGDERKYVPFYGVHQSHAVGAPNANVRFPHDLLYRVLQAFARFSRFGEPPRFDHYAGNPPSRAFANDLRDERGGHEYDAQVHRVRHFENRRIAAHAFDFGVGGVYRINAAVESAPQVSQDRVAAFQRVGRRADQRYSSGVEKKVHRFHLLRYA